MSVRTPKGNATQSSTHEPGESGEPSGNGTTHGAIPMRLLRSHRSGHAAVVALLAIALSLVVAVPASAALEWAVTGSMTTPRWEHTATLLSDGTVLVAGGSNTHSCFSPVLASAEIYNPAFGTWTPTGSMGTARQSATATLLPNGKVLVAGGGDSASAISQAQNCMTRCPGYGPPPGACRRFMHTQPRLSCLTARCLSQGATIITAPLRVQPCMTQAQAHGPLRAT